MSADGRHVAAGHLGNASAESFQSYLLGWVLSFALVKQGYEPLHATAVVVDGKAVAFLGTSGDGKSTLAAAFLHAGHTLLTDDLLLIREIDRRIRGLSRPAAAQAVSGDRGTLSAGESLAWPHESRQRQDPDRPCCSRSSQSSCANAWVRRARSSRTPRTGSVQLETLSPHESLLALDCGHVQRSPARRRSAATSVLAFHGMGGPAASQQGEGIRERWPR